MRVLLALLVQAGDGLDGRIWVGYQGWFNAEGDGAGRGWTHWTKKPARPFDLGNARIDLWPDVSELGPDERFATGLARADGRPAEVFSSFKPATVRRHFRWMKDYGIDGAFVQRFVVDLRDPRARAHVDAVLAACRAGANEHGRAFSIMYDLTGLTSARMGEVAADWKALRKVVDDPAYLKSRGKPLVAVWGVGFGDGRAYSLADAAGLLDVLKADGCAVMLGVPTYWRELDRDAAKDAALHDLLRKADVVSPWTVGRYASPGQAKAHGEKVVAADVAWCRQAGVGYLPVVFPGFSWHHMNGKPLDEIPRRKGEFLWAQLAAAKRAGMSTAYVAMFDEVDEATAIFKCASDVPGFVTTEGLPSDHYLKLTGAGARMLRGEIPLSDVPPR
ncbi:MAG TPA: glycoside hydrolase family 71/99-like protein [Planctomycetota bacterium]